MRQQPIYPSGPTGIPGIGNVLDLARSSRLVWLQRGVDRYGDVFKFRLFRREVYLVNHPDLVREILTTRSEMYSKNTVAFGMVRVVLGESTFTAAGDIWARRRKLVQPSFHKQRIANLSTIMTDTIGTMLDDWTKLAEQGTTIDVADAMMRLTLKVVTRGLFSTALSADDVQTVADVFTPLLEATNRRVSFPLHALYRLPTRGNIRYQQYIDQLDAIIYRIIRQRREDDRPPLDLLQMLMDSTDAETGKPLTDSELRDEIMTVFIAGHETTANAMAWLWATLAQRPDVLHRVEAEADRVLAERIPTPADFGQLEYTQRVFREILRLYPPVPILPRKIEADNVLGDYYMEKGKEIFFSPYLLHRHPEFWEDPGHFDPERFTKARQRTQHPFAYLPFGGGPRICLGNNFALMEAIFIIAMTTQRFRLQLLPNARIEPLVTLTTRPRHGVPVRLERRA